MFVVHHAIWSLKDGPQTGINGLLRHSIKFLLSMLSWKWWLVTIPSLIWLCLWGYKFAYIAFRALDASGNLRGAYKIVIYAIVSREIKAILYTLLQWPFGARVLIFRLCGGKSLLVFALLMHDYSASRVFGLEGLSSLGISCVNSCLKAYFTGWQMPYFLNLLSAFLI